MRKYIVTFTRDYGKTYENRVVESTTHTAAYIIVDLTLPPFGAIISVVNAEQCA
ncbi:MAG: hypothetical protein IKL79_02665 [Clostridia bacterium]|nr:hypothetical protein [Clostridia bacterium]